MRIINASYEIMTPLDGEYILKFIEKVGRTCYESEDRITEDSHLRFVKKLIENGHEAMIEHFSFSVKFICDRGVSHEIVRHRLASFAQESTRFCNYSHDKFGNEVTFIKPFFFEEDGFDYTDWKIVMEMAENRYLSLLEHGVTPEQARSVLPNSLKTELVMTANLREWRHFLRLRTSRAAHPQMRELTIPILEELKEKIPVVFEDIP